MIKQEDYNSKYRKTGKTKMKKIKVAKKEGKQKEKKLCGVGVQPRHEGVQRVNRIR